VSEEAMVSSIIQTIEASTDRAKMPANNSSISNFIYRNSDKVNFHDAINEF
jgi:hypothetical protein